MENNNDAEDLINLIKMNDSVYVWNSKDWLKLRNLRIVGNLVGNLATVTKQDRLTALPMALLNEETTLLLEKGYAQLKILPTILNIPNEELYVKSKKHREELFSKQIELLKRERKEEISSKIGMILQGKQAKTKKPSDSESIPKIMSLKDVLREEFDKIDNCKDFNLWTEINLTDPWIKENDMIKSEWKWSGQTDISYLVFKDLWEKGYYLTLGGKFGGDYLAYPGDPVKFHAYFIIICLKKNKKLHMQDIITYGRLGQSVKKTVVISYLNDNNQICYHSIQWAGF